MARRRRVVDPRQRENQAALALADIAAGGDARRAIELFTAIINIVDRAHTVPKEGNVAGLRDLVGYDAEARADSAQQMGSLRRGRRVPGAGTGQGVTSDPTYLKNARHVIKRSAQIVGGIPTSEFNDCVAIGHGRGWCCTGTLVAPNVVVSAAHCSDGCASRVFIGKDVKRSSRGRVVKVREVVVHPKYGSAGEFYDLMVMVLDDKVNVTPRRIASRAELKRAKSVRLVGYGTTDFEGTVGYGTRRVVDVPIAAPKKAFGARPSIEFVAGAPLLDRDSCSGDSGGPAYVRVRGGWAVAGATSRSTNSADRVCGDGGIYTRLHPFTDWIRSVPGGKWRV